MAEYLGELTIDLNLHGFTPRLDIRMNSAKVELTKNILNRLMTPQKTDDASTGEKNSALLSYIGLVEVKDFDLSLTNGTNTLFTHLLYLELDFLEGSGSIKGISASLREENHRMVDIDEIDLKFNTEGILGKESAQAGISIQSPQVRLARRSLEILKTLLNFPEDRKDEGTSPLNELKIGHDQGKLGFFLISEIFGRKCTGDFSDGS